MDSVAELRAWISAQFWKAEQIAGWATSQFYRRAVHQQTSNGAGSGNLPIITLNDGTIDSSFISSTAIAEYIADTVGAMVTGNTETGISVTYQDADNTLDFDAQTAGDARYAPIAKGVTNGDSHDHNGGDGANIPNAGLVNSQVTIGSTAVSLGATAATVAGLTLTTPTIASFTNATHNHQAAAGGGTLDHGTALTGLSDLDHPGYIPGNGTYTNGNLTITNYSEDVADITSTQALTIQVTSGAARRLHITHFDVACARGANNNIFAYFTGWVAWTWETGGATTIRASDVSHGTSGTDACTLTTITNGIQVVVDSSAFGNTLDSNAVFVHDVSETPVTVATSIA